MIEFPFEDFKSGKCFGQNKTVHQIQTNMIRGKGRNQRCAALSQPEVLKVDEYPLTEGYENALPCRIDSFLNKNMRPHQRIGVKFMFECVSGLKDPRINGVILADSMGLGKTLQAITLIWTLLRQNPWNNKSPLVRKVIIVSPLTLVTNWEKEINKWLGSIRLIPLVAVGTKIEVRQKFKSFFEEFHECLLTSYETFRNMIQLGPITVDLIIFDEGHRLKNMTLKSFQQFIRLPCKRRVILTGTPIQNNMKEFYSCCDFVNPGILNSYQSFKQIYGDLIEQAISGEDIDKELVAERSRQLASIISLFILRRQASILQQFLPPKFEIQIFVKMSDLQKKLYQQTIKKYHSFKDNALVLINVMRKVVTHPDLLYLDDNEMTSMLSKLYPFDYEQNKEFYSPKIQLLKQIVELAIQASEKLVVSSYYCQTLDIIEKYFEQWKVTFVRLDGSVANKKRQPLIDQFNSSQGQYSVFLVNGKSGGAGLNLQKANKMVLMDVDWNPANDLQVMGRVWREGQTKQVYIYRLISCGTFEEKILQRQIIKEKLSSKIVDEKDLIKQIKDEDLKELFTFVSDDECLTYQEKENMNTSEKLYDFGEQEKLISFLKINETKKDEPSSFIQENDFTNQQIFLETKPESSENDDELLATDDVTSNIRDNLEPISEDDNENSELSTTPRDKLFIMKNLEAPFLSPKNCTHKEQTQRKIYFDIEDSDKVFVSDS